MLKYILLTLAVLFATVLGGTTPEGLEYLAENAGKPGVIVLESGLQYKILESGDPSGPSPSISTKCSCDYGA